MTQNNTVKKDKYAFSRFMYIIEAAVEYFISILIGGAYLAKITSSIGISDSLTGILSSFVSLGCGFQIFAIFISHKTPVKRWVTFLHIINQLLFSLLYLTPIINISATGKTVLFTAFLLLGHVISNIIISPKTNWFMSLVDDNKRGAFTANKEIVSLIGGMVFSFVAGLVIDAYEASGQINTAFIVCGITIFTLMIFHSMTLILSKEKVEKSNKVSFKTVITGTIKDKNYLKVLLIAIFWHIANAATTPFYGAYQVNDLGFSMTFISYLSIMYAISRSLFSRPLGKFADRYSFTKMLTICFTIQAVTFFIQIFTVPSNGKYLYTIAYFLNSIAMAGINSGEINLIYDCVDHHSRTAALAIKNTIAGLVGFFCTLAVSPLISYIQSKGNRLFGMHVYAQQVTSLISFILVIAILIYLNTVMKKKKKEL